MFTGIGMDSQDKAFKKQERERKKSLPTQKGGSELKLQPLVLYNSLMKNLLSSPYF